MFKIGQKVICKNATNQINMSIYGELTPVVKNQIYTIRKFASYGGLIFEEFVQGYHFDGEEAGFNPKRFNPLKYEIISNKEIIKEIITDKSDLPINEPVLN